MGGPNKLLADIGGRPMVRIVVEEVLASGARPVIVVTGHQRERVEAALSGLPVTFLRTIRLRRWAVDLAVLRHRGSPRGTGRRHCLLVGDMPQVDAKLINRLIAAFDPERGALVVVPTIAGKRGNPVVWSRRFFPDLASVEGDIGARHLIAGYQEAVAEVPTDTAALLDVDTPDALEAVRATAAS